MKIYDALIVGSGAGGAPVAWTLSRAGMECLVLEKGPHHTRADFVHDEIAICRRDFFLDAIASDPHIVVEGAGAPRHSDLGWTARCVGGGTVHFAGYFYRMHPEDFVLATRHGSRPGLSLADWPFDYATLEPWYAFAEQTVGVSGPAQASPFEPPRSTPYPMPPVTVHPLAGVLDDAGRRLGLHPFSEARAILTHPRGGRANCVYCAFCASYGCEVGAKSSTLEALLPDAVATRKCELRPGTMAREITVDAAGRANGCVAIDGAGREHRIRARLVVVAASAVETARLLLLSRSARFPEGLANSTGQVGRNLQFSINSGGEGRFPFGNGSIPNAVLRDPAPFLGRSLQDDYLLPEGAAELPRGGTLRFGFPHPNPIFTAIQVAYENGGALWGPLLMQKLQQHWRAGRTIEFETFADFLPNPGTRVELDPAARDPHGLPAARILLAEVPHHRQAGAILQRRGRQVLEAMGAQSIRMWEPGVVTGHLMAGACRMGQNPAASVLDADGRAHDCPNLYVTDGAALPSMGGVPPTLTILANAFRIADGIVRRGS